MIVEGINPETGEKIQVEVSGFNEGNIEDLSVFKVSDADIKQTIDGLDISADSKSLLYSMSKTTIKAGQYIIKIGRKIIDGICRLFKEFPNASFGMIFGAIAGFLIIAIPFIGAFLSSVVTPLLIIFGMVKGISEDIKDKALERKISEVRGEFSSLKA